jgi:hypothetical protein
MWKVDPFVSPKPFDEKAFAEPPPNRRVGYFTTDKW